MDVGSWLCELGLGQYEPAFRDNAVDGVILSKLTADDLKEIGVAAVGHRRRLLEAIAALNLSGDSLGVPPAPPVASAAVSVPPAAASIAHAEHRPITVMFCDLVGSTSLAAKLDPEDWRNLVGSYLDAASAAVTSLGGHVLKKLGDGLMALFGYPQAQENDGERAVRAALAIQRALAALNARNATTGAPELAARIGLDSGRVVVDSTGEVYGDAPNVAARVQSAAAPGEIWITRGVHRQVAGLFVAEDKGAHELKGVPEKTQLFRIVRVSGGGRRGGSRAPTPLVGRAEELDLLMRRWERARRGEGQLALIVGEPGLGKSRLIEEFRARLAETPHTWIEWASSQLLQNTPLHPIAEWGRARFGGADVPGEKRLVELEAALGSVGLDAAEYAPLLAPVIDAPLPPSSAPKLSPEELRSRQLAAVSAWVLAGARTQPLVLAFEDLHWADPTSLDVLQALAERGAQAPLLIIATTRPEFRPPWKLRSHHGVISLAPLDSGEVVRMVGEIATRHALSKDVIAGVSERSGGVPLFVEEVTRLLLERGEHGGVQAIPPTLQQSLAARLDRLGPAREIAQIGAVLGRGFSHALLQAVAALDEPALRAALDRLADAELLFVEGVAPQATYRFKHALIQDAAYDSLLKSRRQALHRRAAEVLLASSAPEAEALAYHFTQAGQSELAIEWWGKAGDQALRRSAFAEAISHLGKAIEMADKGGQGGAKAAANPLAPTDRRLKLQTSYGLAMGLSKGFAAEETKAVLSQTIELAAQSENAAERMKAHYARWIALNTDGQLKLAREAAETYVREAILAGDPRAVASAKRTLGMTCFYQGLFQESLECLREALRLHGLSSERSAQGPQVSEAEVSAKAYLAQISWFVGDAAGGEAQFERVLSEALASERAAIIANAYAHKATLEMVRCDVEATTAAADILLDVSEKIGLRLYGNAARVCLSWGRARRGVADELGRFRELGEALVAQGFRLTGPLFLGRIAELEAEHSSVDEALTSIDRAIDLGRESEIRYLDSLLHCIRGDIVRRLHPDDPAAAVEAYLAAIAVAREQGARSFGLQAALRLAKLYQSTGRLVDARDILAPALEGFSPTPELPAIAEAAALFEALAADEAVKAEFARRTQRLKLQTNYGQAVMWSKGFAAEDTKAALARVGELATGIGDAGATLDAYHARWAHSFFRGELRSAHESAESFLREAERAARPAEAAAAHRLSGLTRFLQGDFAEARAHCDQTLRIFDPERDREAKFRVSVGLDSRVTATAYLALVAWCFGDVARARKLMDEAVAGAVEIAHVPSLVNTYTFQAWLEILRADAEAALRAAETCVALSREHGLALYLDSGALTSDWARAKLGDRDSALTELRQAVEGYARQGNKAWLPFFRGLLADIQAERGAAEAALAGIDGALALAGETGEHWFDAGLHRIRGEILIKQNPADPAPAEAAFLAAIAVARQQKARSFELRAALSLAKLYQSTGRPIDAYEVLGPALAGFSPTPEFPAIAEAKALFEALAADESVKAEAARRAQRLRLQTSYGQAVMWSKGFAAEETKAALAQTLTLASQSDNAAERMKAHHARWAALYVSGQLQLAQEVAEAFVREAKLAGDVPAAASAVRILGVTRLYQGRFAKARDLCLETLSLLGSAWEASARRLHGNDTGIATKVYLAMVAWSVGDVIGAAAQFEQALTEAQESEHAPTIANTYAYKATHEMARGDPEATLRAAAIRLDVAEKNGLSFYASSARMELDWARARLGDADGVARLRGHKAFIGQGGQMFAPLYYARLAELEAERTSAKEAVTSIDHAIEVARGSDIRYVDALLHRIRGDILLRRDPANALPAEDAYLTAIAVAREQGARSFGLQAALRLAKLYQSTRRLVDARDILAPALEGFSPTPELPAIAEAKALFEALAADETVKAEAARRAQRLKLQTDYGQAMSWAKGFAAEETKAAFARVGELATKTGTAETPLDGYHTRFAYSFVRGEFGLARERAESYLRAAEVAARPTEAADAHRLLGLALFYQGDFEQARAHFEQTLGIYDPERDREAKFRLGLDSRAAATSYLALAAWCFGEVARARELMNEAVARAVESAHVPTLVNAHIFQAALETLLDDADAALRAAETCFALGREHGFSFFLAVGAMHRAWARAKTGDRDSGSAELRQAIAEYASQGNKANLPLYRGLLAEIEAEGGDPKSALAGVDEALALAGETGEHWFDAGLHRIRGEILLKQNPADPSPAEAAFLAAIAVAQQQKARSFELRAALLLAKLYRSTGRPIDAHDILGPAVQGFSPTPEFSAIAEAMALLEALSQTGEVKAASASLNRRLRLQVAYGNALISARGYSAPETRAAFERARALSGDTNDAAGAYSASYGLWVSSLVRGELASIREATNPFKHVISTNPLSPVAGVAHRVMGTTHWFAGEFVTARGHLERALAIFDPTRDADLAFVFGQDLGVSAKTFLALTLWPLGETDIARRQADEMIVHADQSGHVPTIVYGHLHKASFELTAHRPERAVPHIETSVRVARDNEMPMYVLYGEVYAAWADGYRGRPDGAVNEMRSKINRWREQVGMLQNPLLASLLAEIETTSGETGAALATIDQTIAASQRTGQRWFDAELHRIRGEILLKQNPADPAAAAEAAFLAAIAVAQQQKARSFELRAELSLAKLYQSTNRLIEAHDVLGPALKAFSPTPEFPEIAAAQALLSELSVAVQL